MTFKWKPDVKWLYSQIIQYRKVNNRSTRKRCEISLKLTIKTPERSQGRHF